MIVKKYKKNFMKKCKRAHVQGVYMKLNQFGGGVSLNFTRIWGGGAAVFI